MLRIGTAGWSIRREYAERFDGEGSHLVRYARQLNAAEINSSFHRPHRPTTYARWARETPEGFAFSVKLPRAITHDAKLKKPGEALDTFFAQCSALHEKLGCILVQLPPSLAFEHTVAASFFKALRKRHSGPVALEPRHRSWFTDKANGLLMEHGIARVAADPIPKKMSELMEAAEPGGFDGFQYWRLHGSPRVYYSDYSEGFLRKLAKRLKTDAKSRDVWCIFDNTLGAATAHALFLSELLG